MNEKDLFEKYGSYSKGYVIDIFKDGKEEEYVFGDKMVNPKKIRTTSDTLYDIASITKVFTSVLVYMAYEEGKLDLNSTIYEIDNNFINLKNIKVVDLLSHNQNIWTQGYLGSVNSKKEFYNVLYTAYVKESIPTYLDVHYIILSVLLERIYGISFKQICTSKIFNKLGLVSATFDPNKELCASNNYECRNGSIIDYIEPGMIHDTKGRVAKKYGIYLGNASIFITGKDLLKFLKSFFDYSLLKKDTINFMLKHRNNDSLNYQLLKQYSNKNTINEMYKEIVEKNSEFEAIKTINNMGVAYRNTIDGMSIIPNNASDNTIAFSGYTGPFFLIDFDNKTILVIMCNAVHDNLLNRKQRRKLEKDLVNYCYNKLINNI